MAEAARKNDPNAMSPKGHGWFFRLRFLPAHINPGWRKLRRGSSSGAHSQRLSKPSHPAAKTSPRSAGLVAGTPVLHSLLHTLELWTPSLTPSPTHQ